jgi:hypothetical protein
VSPLPPNRCKAQKYRILTLLRERGARGVLASELYAKPELYGRSPRNRISELRKAGYLIAGEQRGNTDWIYIFAENPQLPQTELRPEVGSR